MDLADDWHTNDIGRKPVDVALYEPGIVALIVWQVLICSQPGICCVNDVVAEYSDVDIQRISEDIIVQHHVRNGWFYEDYPGIGAVRVLGCSLVN